MPIRLKPTFADRLTSADRALVGVWTAASSPITAEIMAGSGADLVLVDGEHSPIGIDGLMGVLQAIEPYDATAVVRVPWNDAVIIKQVLDAGAQSLVVPMVSTESEAIAAVQAMRYPPRGIRGIGSMLARASRWSAVPDYVATAHELVALAVQIETVEGVANAAAIAAVEGVDAIFVGPADLAGSMGFPPASEVRDAVVSVIEAGRAAGTPVGVNAFAPADADHYLAAGAAFVVVAADVTLLAASARAAVGRLVPTDGETGTY
ncbi:HpcH/HpaI aldolase family protein [Agrococcus jejuensis]|uniref:2,4-dihydroxyhept-2-enedioate aldolase n=1 Tax=Agrococcus jejuensis TaxID=399736 RepID=A0A1G8FX05_9MICO|nr:aldolase/citrate lyase family protein [Agrococcus jejuensis]SDH86610.1 2,4-dihydroxyhept-2-enedioate aldolase [Agrococcus jejuensis]